MLSPDARDEMDASAEFELVLKDANGFTEPGFEDLAGCINGQLTYNRYALLAWLQRQAGQAWPLPLGFRLLLLPADFDANGFPLLQLELQGPGLGFKWRFELHLAIAEGGQLALELAPAQHFLSWSLPYLLPPLRSWLQAQLQSLLNYCELGLELTVQGTTLLLQLEIKGLLVPLRTGNYLRFSGLRGVRGVLRRDANKNWQWVFDAQHFLASSDPLGQRGVDWEHEDNLHLHLGLRAQHDGWVYLTIQGTVSLHLSEQETQKIQLQGHVLRQVLEGLRLQIELDSQVSISPEQALQIRSQNTWQFQDVQIQGRTYQVQPTDLALNFDPQLGLQIEIGKTESPLLPHQLELHGHALQLLIGGPAYLAQMLEAIASARHWVDLESFLYFPGQTTRRLTRALALKACGLTETSQGRLLTDLLTPRGVPVFVLFSNLELTQAAAEPILTMFAEEIVKLEQDWLRCGFSARQQRQLSKRLQQHFHYFSYVEGVARADHRKMLLIDGQLGFVGGINLGDKFLAADSFHDLMVAFSGPAVAKAQAAFIQNWRRVSGQAHHPPPLRQRYLQRQAQRQAQRWQVPLSQADLLLTDTHCTEIAWAIQHVLDKARRQIWLEHAYFHHPATLQALLRALERGVEVCIIVPEHSNIELFNLTNTEVLRALMQAQQCYGQGQVKAWLYTGVPGAFSQMAHSKVISVDGRYAVLGSANLTARSLQSPFKEVLTSGQDGHIFFNQELNLYIDDPGFVGELNRRLFEADVRERARAMSFQDVLLRLHQLGGLRALRAAQNQARLA